MNRPTLMGLLGARWRKDSTEVSVRPSWPIGVPHSTTLGDAEMHNMQWYARARRWMPFTAPIIVGGLLLALAQLLTSHGIGLSQDPNTVGGVASLLALYALLGVLWGLSIRLAPSVRLWSALLCGGTMLYLVTFAAALFGLIGMALVLVVLAVASMLYLRAHSLRVEENTLVVTTIWGAYARTLLSGRHVRMPGERLTQPYDLSEREYTTEQVNVEFLTAQGVHHEASASMRVTYRVNPAYGRTLLAMQTNWEQALQTKIVRTFETTLREFSADMLATGRPPVKGMVATAMLTQLRRQGADFGVDFLRVRVRNATLANDQTGTVQPVPATGSSMSGTSSLPGTSSIGGSLPSFSSVPHGLGLHSASLPQIAVYVPPSGALPNGVTPASPFAAPYILSGEMLGTASAGMLYNVPVGASVVLQEQHYNAFSDDTLTESYEAIRDNRITDPETIRAVAAAFDSVAHDPHSTCPFDANAAAQILLSHAANLERQTLQPA